MPTPRCTLPASETARPYLVGGDAALADSIRRLGAHLADGATLSFDDEARAREVAATLKRALTGQAQMSSRRPPAM